LKVAFYERLADAMPVCVDVTWGELVETLTTFDPPRCAASTCRGRDCLAKDSRAWSPVDIEGPRANANVRAVTACVVDLDHLATDEFESVLARVAGVAGVVHTAHSHDPDAGEGSYRLALRLSRPVAPSEWSALRRAVVDGFSLLFPSRTGSDVPRGADQQTRDLSRLFFFPTRRDGAPYLAKELSGEPLDVDALLAKAPPPPAAEPAAAPLVTLAPPGALHAKLAAVAAAKAAGSAEEREQAAVLGRVLAGEALASPGARDATILRATGVVSHWLPVETSWDEVLEVLRPSVAAMDCSPEGLDHWLEVAHAKYERQLVHRRDGDARHEADAAAVRELSAAVKRRKPPGGGQGGAGGGDEDGGCDDAWQEDLIVDKKGVRVCEYNARVLTTFAQGLQGFLRWDDVRRRIDVRGGVLAGCDDEVLAESCAAYLQKEFEFFGGAQLVGRALLCVALDNVFNPLADLLSEYAWDGVQRVDTFLPVYFGAKDDPYTRAVGRRWLVSLVARALAPGCKVDTVLVLEGRQGAGKSASLEALVGADFFLDTHLEIGEKDSMQAIAGAWLVELGELSSLRKAETERIRQFVTSRTDKFRPPYGRAVVSSPRRCVLAGTTNDERYLPDTKGNRRYWPVATPRPDVLAIRRDREKLLAEAAALFHAGERWWFDEAEEKLREAETDAREEGSTMEEAIERWWHEMPPSRRPASLSLLDVAEQALRLPLDRVSRQVRKEVGDAMTAMGFHRRPAKRVETGSSKKVTFYEPSPALLEVAARRRLQVVPGGLMTGGRP